jgi:hypothetical protein
VTTAAEYHQYAQECMQSARDATNDTVRLQFLELAKLWMAAAHRVDDQIRSDPQRTNGPIAPPKAALGHGQSE